MKPCNKALNEALWKLGAEASVQATCPTLTLWEFAPILADALSASLLREMPALHEMGNGPSY